MADLGIAGLFPQALPLHIQMVLLERLAEQRLKNARTPEQQEAHSQLHGIDGQILIPWNRWNHQFSGTKPYSVRETQGILCDPQALWLTTGFGRFWSKTVAFL